METSRAISRRSYTSWSLRHGKSFWAGLDVEIITFDQLNLSKDVSDVVLWRSCQHRDVVLITGNRNDEGPESLEAAIRFQNTDSCLPVLTISDPARIFTDRLYAEHVAERLLETLFDIEVLRGSGRIYLP